MKALLGCLMCLVFTMSQALAISGGPWGGGGRVNTVGTYAGVFVPVAVVVDPGPPPVTLPPDDSLAIFTVQITASGFSGNSQVVIFRNGFFYSNGTMTAVADPDTQKVTGVIQASFIETPLVGTTTEQIEYDASGKFVNVRVGTSKNFSSGSTRLKGDATLTYRNDGNDPKGDSGGPIDYQVIGFRQPTSS